MKFKVGQMVRAKGDRWFNKGELLKIVEVDRSNKLYRCKGTDDMFWQNESDLEPLDVTLDEIKEYLESTDDFKGNKQEEHMKITIETDGHHKTTAECNGITAESLCNPMDDFKLSKGVHMAVKRLLEKLEDNASFYVGDIVEVVANEFNLGGNPVGLQGVVKWSNSHGANVKLPTRDDLLTFYNRELKLIRRGNN